MVSEYITTNSELAILGLLAEKPVYGYEVEQIVTERGMRQWTEIGFSSIYQILKKLAGNGLLSVETQVAGSRPARRVYEITPLGWRVLHDEIFQRLSSPRPHSPDMDLALAYVIVLTQAEILDGLRKQRQSLSSQLAQVLSKWQSDRQHPRFPTHVDGIFSHSCHLLKAEIEWLDIHLEQFGKQD